MRGQVEYDVRRSVGLDVFAEAEVEAPPAHRAIAAAEGQHDRAAVEVVEAGIEYARVRFELRGQVESAPRIPARAAHDGPCMVLLQCGQQVAFTEPGEVHLA